MQNPTSKAPYALLRANGSKTQHWTGTKWIDYDGDVDPLVFFMTSQGVQDYLQGVHLVPDGWRYWTLDCGPNPDSPWTPGARQI